METDVNKAFRSMLEAPWLKKQVETHLIFGVCSRKIPLGWLFIAMCLLYLCYQVWAYEGTFWGHLSNNAECLFFIIGGFYLLRIPKYQQAAIGWWVVKGSLILICFAGLINYGLVGFFKGSPDALHITLMALIWFPGFEFIPRLTEKQKFITIARVALSIPLLILWYRTGTWV